jgi:hypothetical protein
MTEPIAFISRFQTVDGKRTEVALLFAGHDLV